jgi:hypothetical protein
MANKASAGVLAGHSAPRKPFWSKSVTYVAGTFCYPCVRAGYFRIWSGRWESNPRPKLGKLLYCHCTTPALPSSDLIIHNQATARTDRPHSIIKNWPPYLIGACPIASRIGLDTRITEAPLPLAQQPARDFLTPERASVSVKEYAVHNRTTSRALYAPG